MSDPPQQPRELPIWTIYEHPADYPDRYVARLWIVKEGHQIETGSMMASPSLHLIRAFLEHTMHLSVIPRSPEDDPVIVESWM